MEANAFESLNLIILWFLIFPGASFPTLVSLLKTSPLCLALLNLINKPKCSKITFTTTQWENVLNYYKNNI